MAGLEGEPSAADEGAPVTPVRVLFVEDSSDDVELELAALRQGGLEIEQRTVETAADLRAALEDTWDIIICDYLMPELDGLDALRLAKELSADTPFILVSGTVGEDVAVDAMRAGAQDYVLKDNLTRLAVAVQRELHQTESRRSGRLSTKGLRLLADVGAALSSSLDPEVVLQRLPRLITGDFGQLCTIDLVDEAGAVVRAASAHIDPGTQDRLRQLETEHRLQAGAFARIARTLGLEHVVSVPLVAAERVTGTLNLARRRPYVPIELQIIEELSGRIAGALENARLFERAQKAVQLRDEFLSIASHELRTPVTALQLQVQGLQELAHKQPAGWTPDRLSARLERSTQSLARMNQLVESLLDVSRITTGHLVLNLEEVDLTAAVHEVVDQVRDEARRAGSELSVTAPGPIVGRWDRLRLEQVLANLLSNAMKYGAGQPIEIDLSGTGGPAILFKIVDHGIGIAAGDLERIFGRFERAVSMRHYGGLGLGLFLTRQIVEAHGGTVTAAATPGGGATFTVVLPREAKIVEAPAPALPALRGDLASPSERFAFLREVRDYAIFMLDTEGHVLTWNEGARTIKGYEAEEIVGQHYSRFYPPEDRAAGKPARLLRTAIADGRVEDQGWRIRKDGTKFWSDVIITAIHDHAGTHIGFVKVTRDLTERRAIEETLRRSEERLRLLVESVKDYAIFMLDPEGCVATWNQGARTIKGYTAEEILGKHFSTFYPAEDIAARRPERELEIATAEGRYEEEGWRLRKNGQRFWANVVISAIHDPVTGALRGFAKVTRDLTERRQGQELLRQSEERLRLLVESVKDYAIYMLDPEGRITTWNSGAAKIKGYRADEVLGKHFSMFYTPEEVAAGHPDRELQLAIANGSYEEEGWRVRKDGERLWANVVITAINDPVTGKLRGFAKITRDLTERRRIEHLARTAAEEAVVERARTLEAQRALRDRDDFISVAAHELRTPLTALQLKVQGTAQALKRAAARPEGAVPLAKLAERLVGAIRQIDRLTELVERLLDVSRIVRGKLAVKAEETDLSALVRQVVEDFREPALQEGSVLRFSGPPDIVGIWDRALLEQVVINLLSNAIKYGNGKPIEVALAENEAGVQLTVVDQGIGIAQADLVRIFERFERAVPLENYGGLGLGLYVTRNIIEAHHGTIQVTSTAGKGSTFLITLPREQAASVSNVTSR
jgi:PAS domain S-box-containing protein